MGSGKLGSKMECPPILDMQISKNGKTPSYHPFSQDFPWNKPSSYILGDPIFFSGHLQLHVIHENLSPVPSRPMLGDVVRWTMAGTSTTKYMLYPQH